jgi:hypothetical protein
MIIAEFNHSFLPTTYPKTLAYGYGCDAHNPITNEDLGFILSTPGPTIHGISGNSLTINYTNTIKSNHMFNVDWSLVMDPKIDINTE